MHCALRRPFYGASKMAVILGRKAPQSNQVRIKGGFPFTFFSRARDFLRSIFYMIQKTLMDERRLYFDVGHFHC